VWGYHHWGSPLCWPLAGVYGWFTEGFDTPDLQETKVVLAELV
jgi:hypothetical protein